MAAEVAEAAGHVAEHALTPSAYIAECLQNFNSIGGKQASIVDFSVIDWDMMFWSALMGLIGIIVLGTAAHRVTASVPGCFQTFVKLVAEMVDDQAKGTIHGGRFWTAPLVLTVFVWVTLIDAVGLVPVGQVTSVNHLLGTFGVYVPHCRAVATASLSDTFGMPSAVLILTIYYSFKIKGASGFIHELLSVPFDMKQYLTPFNLILSITEFLAKAMSLSMRLFDNIYAGELVLLLIALLGPVWTFSAGTSALGFVGYVMTGAVRAILRILVVLL